MAWNLGLLGAAGAEEIVSNAYELLETTVLDNNASSVEFTNLTSKYATTYQHLELRMVARSTRGNFDNDPAVVQFNGDTASGNYKYHQLYVYSNAVNAGTNPYFNLATAQNASSDIFGPSILTILDPFETTKNTTVLALSGRDAGADRTVELGSMGWFSTNAINSILIRSFTSNNWVTNSRFSLYGLR